MNLVVEGARARLESRATPRLLAVLPRLEGRRAWLKNGHLSIDASGHNFEVLRGAFPEIVVLKPSGGAGLAEEFAPALPPYRPKTQPYDHQERALQKARTQTAFALFMEQGTGKTKVAIDRAGELASEGKITGVLVVAKKGVHRQWIESQLPEHYGGDWSGQYWEGGKLRAASHAPSGGLSWAAFNFDAVKTTKGRKAALDFIMAHNGRVMIVADETQEIKNARSARFKAMQDLKWACRTPYRLALTGTPIAKDLTDEWAQLKWLDENILGMRYVTAFRNEYCIMGGFEGRVVVGHRNVERFRAKVDPFTFRATKDDLGILPKTYRRWSFELSPHQKQAIAQFKQELMHQMDTGEIISAANAAVALVKIQQASNGFVTDESGTVKLLVPLERNPRIAALMEVLEAYEGKAIVWARFRQDIALIGKALSAAGIPFVEYHGGTPDKARGEAVDAFTGPYGPRVFLSNPQAGGTGLNLQGACQHAIYYSNSFNAIDRWQSEDRIHRIGTSGAVVYTDLVAKQSLDAHIAANLKRKKGISDLALGDIREILSDD